MSRFRPPRSDARVSPNTHVQDVSTRGTGTRLRVSSPAAVASGLRCGGAGAEARLKTKTGALASAAPRAPSARAIRDQGVQVGPLARVRQACMSRVRAVGRTRGRAGVCAVGRERARVGGVRAHAMLARACGRARRRALACAARGRAQGVRKTSARKARARAYERACGRARVRAPRRADARAGGPRGTHAAGHALWHEVTASCGALAGWLPSARPRSVTSSAGRRSRRSG